MTAATIEASQMFHRSCCSGSDRAITVVTAARLLPNMQKNRLTIKQIWEGDPACSATIWERRTLTLIAAPHPRVMRHGAQPPESHADVELINFARTPIAAPRKCDSFSATGSIGIPFILTRGSDLGASGQDCLG